MQQRLTDILTRIPLWGFWALLAYMPFHIFLSQSVSLATGGLEVWKIGKDVALAAITLFVICLVWFRRQGLGRSAHIFWWIVAFAAGYGLLHGVIWLAHPDIYERSAILGIIYNNRLFAFLIVGCAAALLTPKHFTVPRLVKGTLIISTIVVALGLIQYVLPKDILTHVGYGLDRGARAAFFIDDHPEFPRIMSTLREPNALAAYLLVPLALLIALCAKVQAQKTRAMVIVLFGAHALALFLTQSRSGWLAAAVVVGLMVWWSYRQWLIAVLRRWWPLLVAAAIVVLAFGWVQRDSTFVQQYIVHSNPAETEDDLDSNDLHWKLATEGLAATAKEPIGHGPGTAGLVSIQNPGGGVLTENYYIQISYEVGWLGLALFVAAQLWIVIRLWRRHDTLGYALCAAAAGYVLTNMLLHTWSNESVAAQWWLLAGVALFLPATLDKQTAKRSTNVQAE